MRVVVVILSALIVLVSCKKDEGAPAVEAIQPRTEDVETVKKILDEAIDQQRNMPQIQAHGRAHEEALAIFQDFWNPKMIKRYGKHEWDSELYSDAKYLIVQRSLVVATKRTAGWPVDELKHLYRHHRRSDDDWDEETIADFCPGVSIPNTIVVSLTKELYNGLLAFLGGDFTDATTPNIMNPAQAREGSRMKLAAADTMVRFYPKHWGDGWHLISHPEVEQILFDREYRHALVSFRIVYQGGYAFYNKTPEGWKLAKSTIDWIE